MPSSWMLRRVALLRTDVCEEFSASIIRLIRMGELGKTPEVTSNRRTLRRNTKISVFLSSVRRFLVTANVVPSSPIHPILIKEEINSSQTPVLTRATRRKIPEEAILHMWECLTCPVCASVMPAADTHKLTLHSCGVVYHLQLLKCGLEQTQR
jgi:Fe-S oxidoreductase